jgi:hypothetical protein
MLEATVLSRAGVEPDFCGLRERLWSNDREARLEAVDELTALGPLALGPLREALGSKCEDTRRAVLLALEQIGGEEVHTLLREGLKDPEMSVRQAAAEALGRVGDERDIGPLTEALRACFARGSARRQLWAGVAVLSGLVLLCLGLMILPGIGSSLGAIGAWVYPLVQYYYIRRRKSALCRAITEALTAIAERAPNPLVRAVLPELQAMAADVIQQDRASREASRAAAARIRALTENVKSLPIAGHGVQPDASALPRPVETGAERDEGG